ncbi:protein adenylyltransferase SelO family protein, partial [Rhizobium hidalgonense]
MQHEKLDYTTSFRLLMNEADFTTLRDDCIDTAAFDQFVKRYQRVVNEQAPHNRLAIMQTSNPVYILRNHIAQRAIELAEQNEFSEVERLFTLLSNPFTAQPEREQPEDLLPPV